MGETGTFFMLLQQEKSRRELAEILACNEETARFGLALSQMEAQELAVCRNESLRRWQREEFGRGILEKLLCGNPPLAGARLILEYLRGIRLEADFLSCFEPGMCAELACILKENPGRKLRWIWRRP